MPSTVPVRLDEDHHIHTCFSDGEGTPEKAAAAAEVRGLTRLGFADHVRSDTRWLPAYVGAVRRLREHVALEVICGVEAKILNTRGDLDLPSDLTGVDRVVMADHQMPGPGGPISPHLVRRALDLGKIQYSSVLHGLVVATEAALYRRPRLLIGHLFSILPKVGLSEDMLEDSQVERLAHAALRSGATLEVSERWRCPSLRVVEIFHDAGVPVMASSDAHRIRDLGRYGYVADVARALDASRRLGAVA